MNTVDKLLDISNRLEHLERSAEWVTRETATQDNTIAQTTTLIMVLADDIREKIYALVKEIESTQGANNDDEDDLGPMH